MRLDLEEGKRLLSEATPGPPWSQDAYYIVGDVRGGRPNGEVIAGFRPSVAHLGMRPHPTKPGYFVEDRDVLNNRANTALAVWAVNNAESLIAAAEEAEKLREMGCAATAWHQRRFPTATQERVALKLAEEAGEVCGAVIAATSGNEHPERAEKVGPEAADTLIVLLVLLGRWYPEIDLIGEVAAKLQRLNVALTPPEPLSAQQETYT